MSPEISLWVPRARITEINPPKIESTNYFKRDKLYTDVNFIPRKPRINYFNSRADWEYKRVMSWYPKEVKPSVIVFDQPPTKKEIILKAIKRIVQRLGLDRVLAWLRNNFISQ